MMPGRCGYTAEDGLVRRSSSGHGAGIDGVERHWKYCFELVCIVDGELVYQLLKDHTEDGVSPLDGSDHPVSGWTEIQSDSKGFNLLWASSLETRVWVKDHEEGSPKGFNHIWRMVWTTTSASRLWRIAAMWKPVTLSRRPSTGMAWPSRVRTYLEDPTLPLGQHSIQTTTLDQNVVVGIQRCRVHSY